MRALNRVGKITIEVTERAALAVKVHTNIGAFPLDEGAWLWPSCKVKHNRSESVANKATIKALGRVFAAEINDRLPFQSKARIYQELCDEELVVPMERKFGGRFPVTVRGWQLTHLGRLTYCTECD